METIPRLNRSGSIDAAVRIKGKDMSDRLTAKRALLRRSILAAACGITGSAFGAPPEFTATDITGWTPTQLSTLPFFKHWTPVPPGAPPAPAGFITSARTASGLYAGSRPGGIGPYDRQATIVSSSGATYIDPYGTYYWSYWSGDADDYHLNWGWVKDSSASDINYAGVAVGRGTLTGSGSYSSGATYHAFVYDAANGRVDPLPDVESSWAGCISNRGEIAGYMYDGASNYGAFRMTRSGQVTVLDPIGTFVGQPRWINASGTIIGSHYPSRSFASRSGSATYSLPGLGSFPQVTALDINDAGWIVGWCGNFADPESFATLWEPRTNGTWIAHDLVEQLSTPDVLLEKAIAIDSQGRIISTGHLDGTDFFGSRLYLLTPNAPVTGWCVPDIGIHPSDTVAELNEATVAIQVVGGSGPFSYAWQWRQIDEPDFHSVVTGPNFPSAGGAARFEISTADQPTLQLAAIEPGTDLEFRCVASNACGTTTSEAAIVGTPSACPADYNGDTAPDVLDFLDFLDDFGSCEGVPAPCGSAANADFNGDTIVDVLDFLDFLDAFGTGC